MAIHEEFARHPWLTTRFVIKRIAEIPTKGLPGARRDHDDGFDQRYGVDTAKLVQVTVTQSANAVHGNRYEAATEAAIRWSIEQADLELADSTFVDVGCGKGRALIVAAQYPFKRIIGVEYAPDLAEICRANLDKIGARRCEVVTADAVDFEFPDGPLLAFFYNPFSEVVHREVLANLARVRGPVRIAHSGPGNAVVRESGMASEIGAGPDATRLYAIQRSTNHSTGKNCADRVGRSA